MVPLVLQTKLIISFVENDFFAESVVKSENTIVMKEVDERVNLKTNEAKNEQWNPSLKQRLLITTWVDFFTKTYFLLSLCMCAIGVQGIHVKEFPKLVVTIVLHCIFVHLNIMNLLHKETCYHIIILWQIMYFRLNSVHKKHGYLIVRIVLSAYRCAKL